MHVLCDPAAVQGIEFVGGAPGINSCNRDVFRVVEEFRIVIERILNTFLIFASQAIVEYRVAP